MKTYLLKNKGVILFYILTILIALFCTYRVNTLKENNQKESHIITDYEIALINK